MQLFRTTNKKKKKMILDKINTAEKNISELKFCTLLKFNEMPALKFKKIV